jgi:hypothetical protein
MAVLPTIAGGSGNAGLGGVYLNPADYPALRPERVRAIAARANRGALTSQDRADGQSMRRSERAVNIEKRGVFGYNDRITWAGYTGRGIRDDGSTGNIEFFEPPQDSGRRQIERTLNAGADQFGAQVLADSWSGENTVRRNQYIAAIQDAERQLVDNARRRSEVDQSITTPEERAQSAADRDRAQRLASARAQKIGDRIAAGSTREARALGARLAKIQSSVGLIGAYAAAIDRGEDPAAAAEELVPEAPAEVVSPLDRLYPLEDDQYYVDTFDALPAGWPEFYVHFVDAASPPLQDDQYYVDTFVSLPAPWANLYQQAISEIA